MLFEDLFSAFVHVRTVRGHFVHFHQASLIMDLYLLKESIEAMEREPERPWFDAQWVWDDYCERHRERYGEHFAPSVDSDWRQKNAQPPKRDPSEPCHVCLLGRLRPPEYFGPFKPLRITPGYGDLEPTGSAARVTTPRHDPPPEKE